MTSDELLADTNRLLQRLIEIDAEHRAQSARAQVELEEMRKKSEVHRAELLSPRLGREGVPDSPGDDWEGRMQAAQRQSKENMEAMREQELAYRSELLEELRTQTDLLRQIARKVGEVNSLDIQALETIRAWAGKEVERHERWQGIAPLRDAMKSRLEELHSVVVPDLMAGPNAHVRASGLALEKSLENFPRTLAEAQEENQRSLASARRRTAALRAWLQGLG